MTNGATPPICSTKAALGPVTPPTLKLLLRLPLCASQLRISYTPELPALASSESSSSSPWLGWLLSALPRRRPPPTLTATLNLEIFLFTFTTLAVFVFVPDPVPVSTPLPVHALTAVLVPWSMCEPDPFKKLCPTAELSPECDWPRNDPERWSK